MSDAEQFETIQRLLDARSPRERLPEALESLAAAIERGHHVALVAAEGARLCRLYAAAALRDLDAERAAGLVLVATSDRARRLARSIERLGGPLGWETVLWTPERAAAGIPLSDRVVIVATPARLLADVRAGKVSIDAVRMLAIDDVAALRDEWAAVDALLQAIDGEVRRIAATHRRDLEFDRLVERLLPRARRWPAELFMPLDEKRTLTGPPLRTATAESHDARLARIVELLHGWAADDRIESVTVWCEAAAIEGVIAALAIEGFAAVAGPTDEGVAVRELDAGVEGSGGAHVVFGLPWSLDELTAALGGANLRAAVVPPRHERQLEILAERAGWPARPLPAPQDRPLDEIGRFRSRVEDAIEERDLASAALLIDPLIEAHGYARVSAALASLLRETEIREEKEPPASPGVKAGPGASAEARSSAPAAVEARRATRPTWSKIFVNVGRQDGVAPGDFVGAITGETGAAGGQIGKIEIRQKFALIDIDSMIVDRVVRGLNGKQIKGRDVVARLDGDR